MAQRSFAMDFITIALNTATAPPSNSKTVVMFITLSSCLLSLIYEWFHPTRSMCVLDAQLMQIQALYSYRVRRGIISDPMVIAQIDIKLNDIQIVKTRINISILRLEFFPSLNFCHEVYSLGRQVSECREELDLVLELINPRIQRAVDVELGHIQPAKIVKPLQGA